MKKSFFTLLVLMSVLFPALVVYEADAISLSRVKVSDFTAKISKGKVILKWKTESEADIEGFNIWRAKKKKGNYSKQNQFIIPAGEGGVHKFTDNNIRRGNIYYYKREDIDIEGESSFTGPVKVKYKKRKK